MAENKTKATEQSVDAFIESLPDEKVRQDCYALITLMKKVTGSEPKLWGGSIVGFGNYHYKYESGHEGDSCLTGFSPRKQNITLYAMLDSNEREELLNKLGKHKAGKGCVYIKRLDDVDVTILEKLLKRSVEYLRKLYPAK